MSLHAELHRHLGGAVAPRIFWRYLHRFDHPLAKAYPDYDEFEDFVTRPRPNLTSYLELHTMVEQVQRRETLPYFVSKLVRGAYVFEGICYLELRHTPYYRTDSELKEHDRIEAMGEIVDIVAESARSADYPVVFSQILCMHSRLSYSTNRAIVDLAASKPESVCGIDLAGPDTLYSERLGEWERLYTYAKSRGLKTTGHLFETSSGCHESLLPLLDRIGHGIQIPLRFPSLLRGVAERKQCLEVCPTTYLKTGSMVDLFELRPVFDRCEDAGVDIAICTDNAGLHNVRLPFEIENLLNVDVIDFDRLERCHEAAFRHAFAWPHDSPPDALLRRLTRAGNNHLFAESSTHELAGVS